MSNTSTDEIYVNFCKDFAKILKDFQKNADNYNTREKEKENLNVNGSITS